MTQQLVKWHGNAKSLEDMFFKVELRPIKCTVPGAKDGDSEKEDTIPRFHAVVAHAPGEVISVVTGNYHLVTNRQAYEAAKRAFGEVFKSVRFDEMAHLGGHLSARRSVCHIDLVHSSLKINVFADDPWYPYVRVTNSYNRQHALQITLGFVRGACSNGFILGSSVIEYKAAHTRKNLEDGIEFPVPPGWFEKREAAFVAKVRDLRTYPIEAEHMLPLSAMALGFRPHDFVRDAKSPPKGKRGSDHQRDMRRWFKDKATSLLMRYGIKEKMTNLYGVLNMATDFATVPPEGGAMNTSPARLQANVGLWADEIFRTMRAPGFKMAEHTGPMQEALEAA